MEAFDEYDIPLPSVVSFDDHDNDIPHDEKTRSQSRPTTTTTTATTTATAAAADKLDREDELIVGMGGKKKTLKDRPWQTDLGMSTNAHGNESATITSRNMQQDIDIFGVKMNDSNIISPPKPPPGTGAGYGTGTGTATAPTVTASATPAVEQDYDDVLGSSSRWNKYHSSPQEVHTATINAVTLAASKIANQLDDEEDPDIVSHDSSQDDNDDISHDDDSSYDNGMIDHTRNTARRRNGYNQPHDEYDFPTPRKAADHNRVRMEALNLLNMANSTTATSSAGNPFMEGITPTSTTSNSSALRKNRVQSALQGLSDKMDSHGKQKKMKKKQQYSKLEFVDVDMDDGMNDQCEGGGGDYANTKDEMNDNDLEYGNHVPSATSKNGTSWGSRYSIDRQMMALYGGLSSQQVLHNMEQEQQSNNINDTSATNMQKTGPYDNRWNVESGRRSVHVSEIRMFNTWIASMKEAMVTVKTKVSTVTTRIGNSLSNNDSNGHAYTTTNGSHRNADHSSSPKNIFTGLAITHYIDKLSPKSQSAFMNRFFGTTSSRNPDDVNFSATDDYIYDRRARRKRFYLFLVILLISLGTMLGIIMGVSSRHSGYMGAIYSDVGEKVQFYVTNDVPHNTADEVKLTRDLANLHGRNGDFLIHLGDVVGDASVTMCTMGGYQDAANLLKQSPIPVFIIPGDNDWNNCPDPNNALNHWMDELNRFEDYFDKADNTNFPIVRRQLARSENFSFLHKGVLFMAFHLVDGKVQNESEWSLRIAEDVAWMDQELNEFGVDEYRAIVILAHAAPTPKIGDFVWPLKKNMMKLKKPVLYLHANDGGEGMLEYTPFPEDLPFLTAVRMEKGYKAPPTQVSIEAGPKPFVFNFA